MEDEKSFLLFSPSKDKNKIKNLFTENENDFIIGRNKITEKNDLDDNIDKNNFIIQRLKINNDIENLPDLPYSESPNVNIKIKHSSIQLHKRFFSESGVSKSTSFRNQRKPLKERNSMKLSMIKSLSITKSDSYVNYGYEYHNDLHLPHIENENINYITCDTVLFYLCRYVM